MGMTNPIFDQFTRWCCPKCGQDGIDSWNKAVWDGPGFQSEDEIPQPWIIGGECFRCWHPCVMIYPGKDAPPRVFLAPSPLDEENAYSYELQALDMAENNPLLGTECLPSTSRDRDWSGGCLAAKGQLQ